MTILQSRGKRIRSMAKTKHTDMQSKKRARSTEQGREDAENARATFLDQAEVMKAMKAQMEAASAAKGKGRDLSEDSEDDESGSDGGSSAGESDDHVASAGGDAVSVEDGVASDAESSTQALSPNISHAPLPSRVTASSHGSKPKPMKQGLASAPKPSPETTFESLGLSAPIISALNSISIKRPTEIQSACVGPIMAGT